MKKVYIDKDGKIYEGFEAEVVEQVEENLKTLDTSRHWKRKLKEEIL